MNDERRNSSRYGPGLWPDARYDLVQDYTEPDNLVSEFPAPGVAASVCPPLQVGVVIETVPAHYPRRRPVTRWCRRPPTG